MWEIFKFWIRSKKIKIIKKSERETCFECKMKREKRRDNEAFTWLIELIKHVCALHFLYSLQIYLMKIISKLNMFGSTSLSLFGNLKVETRKWNLFTSNTNHIHPHPPNENALIYHHHTYHTIHVKKLWLLSLYLSLYFTTFLHSISPVSFFAHQLYRIETLFSYRRKTKKSNFFYFTRRHIFAHCLRSLFIMQSNTLLRHHIESKAVETR